MVKKNQPGFWTPTVWIRIPTPLFAGSVSANKMLNISEPQFPWMENGPYFRVMMMIKSLSKCNMLRVLPGMW